MKNRIVLLANAAACCFMLSAANAQTPPAISVRVTPTSANEGAKFQVTFTRVGDTTGRSTVNWAVSGAVDGADFGVATLPKGTVTFTAGQAQKGFALFSTDDTTGEADERFDVTLSAPTNASIATGLASATILNNDVASRSPLTLINPSHSTYWAQEDAFINHLLVAGKDHDLWVSQGLLDPVSATFVKMPASGPIKIGPVRGGSVIGAGNYYKGKWILDWQGDGDVTITGGVGTLTRVSTNRVEEDYDPALHGIANPVVRITRIGAGGISNIRFYRATHETAINAGQIFDPRWLRDVSRFDVVRPMDWTGVNSDKELFATDRPPANRPFYMSGRVPDHVLVRAAVDSGTALWLNAPGLLGCPPSLAATLRDTTLPNSARIAAAAAAFDQVMASQEPLLWARKIVAELNAQGYPASRHLYIELDNEVWNTTFHASTNLYSGLGQTIAARHPGLSGTMRTGYGYRSAQFAKFVAQALAEGGRSGQPWTMVLAAQTVDPVRTVDALAAVPAFGGTQPMSRYGVSTTNYVSGGFIWHRENRLFGAPMTQAAWGQRWLADLAADPAALYQRITNYLLSPTPSRANVAYYSSFARAQKTAAEAAGARWIGNFEGDSTDKLDPTIASNAAAVALYRQWHESVDYGRVITAFADATKALSSNAIVATYVFCAARRTPSTPWAECTPFDQSGGDNAAWNTLLKP